jgi:hypothetical protein
MGNSKLVVDIHSDRETIFLRAFCTVSVSVGLLFLRTRQTVSLVTGLLLFVLVLYCSLHFPDDSLYNVAKVPVPLLFALVLSLYTLLRPENLSPLLRTSSLLIFTALFEFIFGENSLANETILITLGFSLFLWCWLHKEGTEALHVGLCFASIWKMLVMAQTGGRSTSGWWLFVHAGPVAGLTLSEYLNKDMKQ